jgi:hypothetical protein
MTKALERGMLWAAQGRNSPLKNGLSRKVREHGQICTDPVRM